MITVHATCVTLEGQGVLIRGPSGSGKSDLAVRVLAEGGRLVADDRVTLTLRCGIIVASAPPSIQGMIEIRGVGILRVEAETEAPLALVVDLTPSEAIERLPEQRHCALLGFDVPWIQLAPFEASALAKLRMALLAAADPARLAP
jgi:HPr kinase/phosphorylase